MRGPFTVLAALSIMAQLLTAKSMRENSGKRKAGKFSRMLRTSADGYCLPQIIPGSFFPAFSQVKTSRAIRQRPSAWASRLDGAFRRWSHFAKLVSPESPENNRVNNSSGI